jgi:hypothetical protein
MKLFMEGGPLFMGFLTIVFSVILFLFVFHLIMIQRKDYKYLENVKGRLKYIKSFGLFALVTGFLGQMIGLVQALDYIEQAPDISTSLMAGGLKVSMIAPLYGMFIFLISYLLWVVADFIVSRDN